MPMDFKCWESKRRRKEGENEAGICPCMDKGHKRISTRRRYRPQYPHSRADLFCSLSLMINDFFHRNETNISFRYYIFSYVFRIVAFVLKSANCELFRLFAHIVGYIFFSKFIYQTSLFFKDFEIHYNLRGVIRGIF